MNLATVPAEWTRLTRVSSMGDKVAIQTDSMCCVFCGNIAAYTLHRKGICPDCRQELLKKYGKPTRKEGSEVIAKKKRVD